MLHSTSSHGLRSVLLGLALSCWVLIGMAQPAVDAEAARGLAKKSDCFKCHTVDQKKVNIR